MHALIVDDEKDILDVFKAYFDGTDCRVDYALSGEDALFKYHCARTAEDFYDVLVIDIALPDMAGTKVVRIIRESNDDIPVIVCTAFDRALNRFGAEDVQAAAYLTKPLTPYDLHDAMSRVVTAETGEE